MVYDSKQLGRSNQAIKDHLDQKAPLEDTRLKRIGQAEVDKEVEGEVDGDKVDGGKDVAHGKIALKMLFNDEQIAYGIEFDHRILCERIFLFPAWSPQYNFGG